MGNPKAKKVIDILYTRTMNGQLPWKETEEKGTFQISFADYSVRIDEIMSDEDTVQYLISIYDHEGEIVEQIGNYDLRELGFSNPSLILTNIYSGARRKAKGVDKAFDSILSSLQDKDDDIPF